MANAFKDSLDIANRGLFHLGLPSILSIDEDSERNETMSTLYDQDRQAELRRNIWRFSKRKVWLRPIAAGTRLLAPKLFNVDETYMPGAIVRDENGDQWISWKADNYGNTPGASDAWDSYYGPLTVDEWVATISYYAGEIVYKQVTAGSFALFLNLKAGNTDDPAAATAYDAAATYGLGDRVLSGGFIYRSIVPFNRGLAPAAAPNAWAEGNTYNTADTALGSDGFIYTCVSNGTVNLNPVEDDGTFWTKGAVAGWTRTPTQYTAAQTWLPLFSGMENVPGDYVWLTGDGNNAFHLPAGWLRTARNSPKGVPVQPDDHEPKGNYIISSDPTIQLEFVADIKRVTDMDILFCEGLACRMALDGCEKLTQSNTKTATISQLYSTFMGDARLVNGVEIGPEEPDEDDYITCRA